MIELITTNGLFCLDGGEWEVTNNVWLVGDDRQVVVVDAAQDAAPIVAAVNGRRVRAIALTHGHNDHINAAADLQIAVDAPILLHPEDHMLWRAVCPDRLPDQELAEGDVLATGREWSPPTRPDGGSGAVRRGCGWPPPRPTRTTTSLTAAGSTKPLM